MATSPVPKRSYLEMGTSSSRRLVFDEKFDNDNNSTTPFEFHINNHLQKQFQISYEDDFSKQSDQETEESNSCLRSIPSDGKSSQDKEFMEIEQKNESALFHSHMQGDQDDFTGSPLLKKKLRTSPFATNMKALDRELLNTPTKKAISYDPIRGSYSAAVKVKRMEEEGVPRLHSDYKDIECIGEGSFGKVYRCLNKLDNAEYAIKELKKFVGKHRVSGLNEIQALASLNAIEENTNVVRYYHSWVEDEKLYLVMEYCPMSLKQEMKEKGHFSETELKRILRDICVGLSYLHRNDIVHLDIKPENILISKAKKYKLGDMGQSALAKLASDDVEEGDARYLAPELLNSEYSGKLELTKTDVFSLGITLYELATGSSIPMNGEGWHALRKEQLEKLDQITTLSDSFKKLIKLMLRRDPRQRPSVQELLTHHLPDQIELELRWEKLQRKLLKQKKEALEQELSGFRKLRRRNSVE